MIPAACKRLTEVDFPALSTNPLLRRSGNLGEGPSLPPVDSGSFMFACASDMPTGQASQSNKYNSDNDSYVGPVSNNTNAPTAKRATSLCSPRQWTSAAGDLVEPAPVQRSSVGFVK